MKKIILFTLLSSALLGCISTKSSAPYKQNNASMAVAELDNAALSVEGYGVYETSGFIETFKPNYFVIVGVADEKDLSADAEGASTAARQAVEKFDCANGTEVKAEPKYATDANQWLVVVDCAKKEK